ncbi:uncharacterized protein LOC144107498 isoform X1 [Amblyomma americanum]
MKGRSSAAKRFLLRRLAADEIALTERRFCGTSWSEALLLDVSSTREVSHDAQGDHVENKADEQQEWKLSQPSPSASSSAPANMEEDGTPAFSSTAGFSQSPRLHQWSSMSLVQLSIVVVALAVAIVITLLFKLRNKDKGGPEDGDDHRISGFRVDRVSRDAISTPITRGYLVSLAAGLQRHGQSGGDRQKQGAGLPAFTPRNDDEVRPSAKESPQAVSRFSSPGNVVWGNDDGFAPGRLPLPSLGPETKRREAGRQHDPGATQEKKASAVKKGAPGVSSPTSNQEESFRFGR